MSGSRGLRSPLAALFGLVWTVGCAHRVAWQIQPAPGLALPSLKLAVIAEDRGCKEVADALVATLRARPGVDVDPAAPVQLRVGGCDYEVLSTLDMAITEMATTASGMSQALEHRRYLIDGWATASMTIVSADLPPHKVEVGAERHDLTPWSLDAKLPVSGRLDGPLSRDLAWGLADTIAPLPETLRRRLYADPEPGTARALHNRAVEAEREGKLDLALQLAREAYAADPSAAALSLIEELQAHASRVGYALAD